MNKAILVADGLFPTNEIPLKVLRSASFIIACDGAFDKLLAHGFNANILIGDLDSVINENLAETIVHIKEQNTNDLTKAFNYALTLGFKYITILGATGLREDHSLVNIALLSRFSKQIGFKNNIARVNIISDFGQFFYTKGNFNMPSYQGQQISIFSLKKTLCSSKNLKYPLKQLILKPLIGSALNEATNNYFSIKTKGNLIIYKQH